MGFHTFDPSETDRLEQPSRFRFCSREELLEELPRTGTVLDLGSGTGFYTDELAGHLERVIALDLQPAMHRQYGERGVPATVDRVTADATALPFATDSLAGTVSTMTVHESASPESIEELHRVLAPGAPVVLVDWSREGQGAAGPPLSERYDAAKTRSMLRGAGFAVETARERSETFRVVATAERR